ncbi:MAG: gamma-glutamyltransferase [Candidatus Thorarchaeota archaeon]|nr:MAG: gamma-glutamyltransferase [Candidatus Thorarchaeota archaeon]
MFWRRPTGRSDVIAKDGMVASSQPLATQAGIEILRNGGNAIDAAVAVAAVLDVVEPFSTGCGGDAFALLHLSGRKKPLSFNGSGRSGSLATIDDLLEKGWTDMPVRGGAPVTVPGAMHLWDFLVRKYGNLELKEVLSPSIHYAREGFPVSPLIADSWPHVLRVLINNAAKDTYTIDGRPPVAGETMRNPDLANVFEMVTEEGVSFFYEGETADAVSKTIQEHGGFVTPEDLARHETVETEPISTDYRGLEVFEHPPNGQGFAALIMLNIMEEFEFGKYSPFDADRYHIMIEAKKLAYADLHAHNADPDHMRVTMESLLSKDYSKGRSASIELYSSMDNTEPGIQTGHGTVYLATADSEGNAVSFINSLYMGIGSGLVVEGYGIKLQNRGNLFSLDPSHPNCYGPNKLPFHTIIPGALYSEGEFHGVFGIMGGAHQAQAHAQFVSNIVDCDMWPQQALDHPRFNHDQVTNQVAVESRAPIALFDSLGSRGHHLIDEKKSGFGGGQAILRLGDAWIAGSDLRKDGQAAGI